MITTEILSENAVRLSRVFSAPKHKVFRAWTDPVHLKNWFHVGPEYAVIVVEVDFRIGGIYRLGMKHIASGKEHITGGKYLEIIPNEKLVYTWQWENERAAEGETLVTVEFQESNGLTELTLTHKNLLTTQLRDEHTEGWTAALGEFAKSMEELMQFDKIELSVFIQAPPDKVYRHLTDEKLLTKWFLSKAKTDPHMGGKYEFEWEFSDDSSRNHRRKGEFLEVVPAKKIRYTWDALSKEEDHKIPDTTSTATIVEFNLAPLKNGTEVGLTHIGWGKGTAAERNFDSHYGGWSYFLENLKSYIEQGYDTRKELAQMLTY